MDDEKGLEALLLGLDAAVEQEVHAGALGGGLQEVPAVGLDPAVVGSLDVAPELQLVGVEVGRFEIEVPGDPLPRGVVAVLLALAPHRDRERPGLRVDDVAAGRQAHQHPRERGFERVAELDLRGGVDPLARVVEGFEERGVERLPRRGDLGVLLAVDLHGLAGFLLGDLVLERDLDGFPSSAELAEQRDDLPHVPVHLEFLRHVHVDVLAAAELVEDALAADERRQDAGFHLGEVHVVDRAVRVADEVARERGQHLVRVAVERLDQIEVAPVGSDHPVDLRDDLLEPLGRLLHVLELWAAGGPASGLLRPAEREGPADATIRANPVEHGRDFLHRGEGERGADVQRLLPGLGELVGVLGADIGDRVGLEAVARVAVALEPLQHGGGLRRLEPGKIKELGGQDAVVVVDVDLRLLERGHVYRDAAIVETEVEVKAREDLGARLERPQGLADLALHDHVLTAVGGERVPALADGHAAPGDREAPVPRDLVFEDRAGAGALELLPVLVLEAVFRRQQIDDIGLVGEDADEGLADRVLLVAELEELSGLGQRVRQPRATGEELGAAPLLQRGSGDAELRGEDIFADRGLEAHVERPDRGSGLHCHAEQVERLAGLGRVGLVDAPDGRGLVVLRDGEQQDARARVRGIPVAAVVDGAGGGRLKVEAEGRKGHLIKGPVLPHEGQWSCSPTHPKPGPSSGSDSTRRYTIGVLQNWHSGSVMSGMAAMSAATRALRRASQKWTLPRDIGSHFPSSTGVIQMFFRHHLHWIWNRSGSRP